MNNIDIKSLIRVVPDWPKQGIQFMDITTLLNHPEGYKQMINTLYDRYKDKPIDAVVGLEARGFITGAPLAHKLGVGFIPIRKPGKLPSERISIEYDLEYGKDTIKIHKDAFPPGSNILISDDLIATGGTALAACNLIKKLQGNVYECSFIIDLPHLGGRKKLEDVGYKSHSLTEFSGD